MKNLILFLALALIIFLTACTPSSEDGSATFINPGEQSACSLSGNWSRCEASGTSSSQVQIQFTGSSLEETIQNYNSNTSCSGNADDQAVFTAMVSLGPIGQSVGIQGGTDADLVPSEDIVGCGAGQPIYTTIKFSSDCSQFQAPAQAPGCSASARGSSVDPVAFQKQN